MNCIDNNEIRITVFEMINLVKTSHNKLLNLIDRLKSESKCGDNIALCVSNLQQQVERFIKRTRIQAEFIMEFTNLSKKYWIDLTDRHAASIKFNKNLHQSFNMESTNAGTTNAVNNNNNNNVSSTWQNNSYQVKDVNSVFNTIQASISTIPVISVNESIISKPKTYIYTDVIESVQSFSGSEDNLPFNPTQSKKMNFLLSHYKIIESSQKTKSEFMTNFKEDLTKISNFTTYNNKLYNDFIVKYINEMNEVLKLQLQSLGYDEFQIDHLMIHIKNCCNSLNNSIIQVINTIHEQQRNSKVYLINTVQYWIKLNELDQDITSKIGSHLLLISKKINSTTTQEPSKNSRIKTIF
jgi:hypothetical protein